MLSGALDCENMIFILVRREVESEMHFYVKEMHFNVEVENLTKILR